MSNQEDYKNSIDNLLEEVERKRRELEEEALEEERLAREFQQEEEEEERLVDIYNKNLFSIIKVVLFVLGTLKLLFKLC